MSKYTISPEGAEAMEALAQNLLLGARGILEASSALQQKSLALGDDLGIYREEIHAIIQQNISAIKSHKESITVLAQAAKQQANGIKALFLFDGNTQNGAGSGTLGYGQSGPDSSPQKAIRSYSQEWTQQLSEEQKSAIHDYTKEIPPLYKNINGVLRGREKIFDSGNYERSERIHSALQQASTPCDLTLYRGGGKEVLGDLAFASDDELLEISYFQDKGYCSTSLSQRGSFPGDVLLVLHLPAGSHAASIEHLSASGTYEEEVLIDRGYVYHITGVHRDQNGRRIVEIDVLT